MPLGTQRCVVDADGLAEAPDDDYAGLKLEQDKMQAVCDDPANRWILKLPHVSALTPAVSCRTPHDCEPAISIQVDYPKDVEAVERKTPPTLGGYPVIFHMIHDPSAHEEGVEYRGAREPTTGHWP
jgi:hypothetical protein